MRTVEVFGGEEMDYCLRRASASYAMLVVYKLSGHAEAGTDADVIW